MKYGGKYLLSMGLLPAGENNFADKVVDGASATWDAVNNLSDKAGKFVMNAPDKLLTYAKNDPVGLATDALDFVPLVGSSRYYADTFQNPESNTVDKATATAALMLDAATMGAAGPAYKSLWSIMR